MFIIGQTVRIAQNVPGDHQSWCRIGELVRITAVVAGGYAVEKSDGQAVVVSVRDIRADASLPMFDEYRPEGTGCLF